MLKRLLAVLAALLMPLGTLNALAGTASAQGVVGNGFVVSAGDLDFILKQIKIAERHSWTQTAADPCGTMVGTGPDQIPSRLNAFGLRTVDGSCNNLFPGRERFAAADEVFPRLAPPQFRPAEAPPAAFGGGPATSYAQKLAGNVVFDSQPRVASNLIVDQTSANPAAVAAAGHPLRSQSSDPTAVPCTTDPNPTAVPPVDGVPEGCTPSGKTLFIPNVTTDVGLSPPFNSWFTFFGQFFDHGVDQTVKGGGTVFVPLKADDPLITVGPDLKPGTGDEVPASQAFMVLTRAQNQPGPDGALGTADDVTDTDNTDSPWVDQSQTYTSHASHQVFLREYTSVAGRPQATGKLLGGLAAGGTYPGSPDGRTGISSWASVKAQAASVLGLSLQDADVTRVPMLATDPYGQFLPGPARGLPQYVTTTGLVEGNLAAPVPVPANVRTFDTPFLTDIAKNADPSPADTDRNPATPPVAPTPDGDTVPNSQLGPQTAGTYDDEGLRAHFACGDGRCNENIALTAVHQVFHSEHDRLVADITATLNRPENAALRTAFQTTVAATPGNPTAPHTFTFGERLFQAARFVTEMEYQHLVFEEFGRKVQPAIRPFTVYSPDINPAIDAEFAHAVYRFGHSQLVDDVARVNEDPVTGAKTFNSLPLLNAFLSPAEYQRNGTGTYTPEQAAGAIIMGSSDQTGNEIDEFVTEALRNRLLGLPLDLATLNMARARDAGVPSLNGLRRQIFAETNDGQLTPYSSWSDLGQHLKHPQSLVNFVATYGKHPTITAATTTAAKRAAARAIVDPSPGNPTATPPVPADVPPADAADFMFSTGSWSAVNATGLEDVDLWVGGLAELTNLNGGMLGSTFNHVFQGQMEKLQDNDRLYYLGRLPGLNLRTQIEGNSFAEMIQRNTAGTHTLKADVFARADCKFELSRLTSPATSGAILGAGSVQDDPLSECNENALLLKQPNGTFQYRQQNSVDPPGINGQSVFNGTANTDRIFGGVDNDTFWGNPANDVIEGNNGDDVALGGLGNDIMTDLNGADVPKGGPGNDAIDGGPGDDIIMGNEGADMLNGGADINEEFAGPGNDLVIAGQANDVVFGDDGDDWIQGGTGQDLLQGDHGAPFFDDPGERTPGNDIFVGQTGENDYDAEGGDDIMSQNAAVDRNAGAGGFDWAIHQYDTVGADDDMMINQQLAGLPLPVVVTRDRWQETEADSGSAFNDVIRGDDTVPSAGGGAGFTGCNVLDQNGVNRIAGLAALLPQPLTGALAPVQAAGANGCPYLSGPIWGDGNILLGGAGTDQLTGRGGNDVIDGDKALTVRLSVRTDPANPATEIGSTDLIEGRAKTGNFGAGTTGMTLQQAVFAGLLDPGRIVPVREILPPTPLPTPDCASAAPVNCDVAVFQGPQANYTVTRNANGSVTVTQTGANVAGQRASDATDTLTGIERMQFSDGLVGTVVNGPAAGTPTITDTNPTPGVTPTVGLALTASTAGITDPNGVPTTFTFQWQGRAGTAAFADIPGATAATFTPTAAQVNQQLQVVVRFTDLAGNPETRVSAPTVVTGNQFLGDGLANVFTGTAGADIMRGNGGNDSLTGNPSDDVLEGGTGTDTIIAGSGLDTIEVTGNDGSFDTIDGQADADRLIARANNTVMGIASIAGTEEINANGFTGVTLLGSGADNVINLNTVNVVGVVVDGGGGNDTLSLPDTNNTVNGGTGNDTIDGRGGDDLVTGGQGNDTINTNVGNDTLVVADGFGTDTVNNFDALATGGQERIDLRPLGVTAANFAQRVTITTNLLTLGSTITVRNAAGATAGVISTPLVLPANFNATDFILG